MTARGGGAILHSSTLTGQVSISSKTGGWFATTVETRPSCRGRGTGRSIGEHALGDLLTRRTRYSNLSPVDWIAGILEFL
jgi:hypothetical protein